jgi:hypothetical protein
MRWNLAHNRNLMRIMAFRVFVHTAIGMNCKPFKLYVTLRNTRREHDEPEALAQSPLLFLNNDIPKKIHHSTDNSQF